MEENRKVLYIRTVASNIFINNCCRRSWLGADVGHARGLPMLIPWPDLVV
jgi:hypothetical protein